MPFTDPRSTAVAGPARSARQAVRNASTTMGWSFTSIGSAERINSSRLFIARSAAKASRAHSRDSSDPPQLALHFQGRQYMTNCYNTNPTNGAALATLWLMRDGTAAPVAAMGRTLEWPLLKTDPFRERWGANAASPDKLLRDAVFLWSDVNGDGAAQPEEVTIRIGRSGGVAVMPDLSFVESHLEGKAMRFAPKSFTAGGAPVCDLAAGEVLAADAAVHSNSRAAGIRCWQARAAGQSSPRRRNPSLPKDRPEFAMENHSGVIPASGRDCTPRTSPRCPIARVNSSGRRDSLGGVVYRLAKARSGPLWCVNGNMGPMYLFTARWALRLPTLSGFAHRQALVHAIRTARHVTE